MYDSFINVHRQHDESSVSDGFVSMRSGFVPDKLYLSATGSINRFHSDIHGHR